LFASLQKHTREAIPVNLCTYIHVRQTLEKERKEFSVRVSMVELYNEELRDLLAVDDSKKLRLQNDKKVGAFVFARP
jgi:kinesin family protein 11